MAENKINIGLALKAELDTSQEDLAQLRNEPGLTSKKAKRNLNEVEGLLNSLSATDFTKLKGADLTRVLNQFAKIRDLLDSASRSLTKFSNEYLEVAKKVEDAREIQLKATDNYADALSRKKSTLADVKINDEGSYFQNKGGRRITNLKTIVKNYRAGTLRVFNQEGTELQGPAKQSKLKATGVPAYSKADSNAAHFKAALDDATESLKKLEAQLGQTNPGHELHPTTKTITEHSVGTHNIIAEIKEQGTEETQKSIEKTEQQLEGLSDTITKQDTVWSKAFKRISLYAIA